MKSIAIKTVLVLGFIGVTFAYGMYSTLSRYSARPAMRPAAARYAATRTALTPQQRASMQGVRGYSEMPDQGLRTNIPDIRLREATMTPPEKPSLIAEVLGYFGVGGVSKEKQAVETIFEKMVNEVEKSYATVILHFGAGATFLDQQLIEDYIKAVDAAGGDYNIINRPLLSKQNPNYRPTLFVNVLFLVIQFWSRYWGEVKESRTDEYRSRVVERLFEAGARLKDTEKEELLRYIARDYKLNDYLMTLQRLHNFARLCLLLDKVGLDLAQIGIDVKKAKLFSQEDLGELGRYHVSALSDVKERAALWKKYSEEGKPMPGRHIKQNDIPIEFEKQALKLADLVFISEPQNSKFTNE